MSEVGSIPKNDLDFYKKTADRAGKALEESRAEVARLRREIAEGKKAREGTEDGKAKADFVQKLQAAGEQKTTHNSEEKEVFVRYYNKTMVKTRPELLDFKDYKEFKEKFAGVEGLDTIIKVERFRLVTEQGLSVTTGLDIDPTKEEIYVSLDSLKVVDKANYDLCCKILGKDDLLSKIKTVYAILEISDGVTREVEIKKD